MTRIDLVSVETRDPDLLPVFERMKKRWNTVLNLYRALAWSPALVKAWAPFAWSLRFDLKASRRLRELMVIHIARHLGATYEYEHHVQMAFEEGISAEQVADLPRWRDSGLFDADEQLMLALGDELALGTGASAAVMKALETRFGNQELMEFLVTGAYYCAVARIVNSLDLDLEPEHHDLRARNN